MAELTEQQESPVGEGKRPPRSRGGFWFGVSVLLLVFGLAGAGFFLFSQLRAKQEDLGGEVKNEMSKQLGGYQSQLSAIQTQMAALQADMANKDSHFSKTVNDFSRIHDEKLDNTRKELNESIQRLQRQLGKTRGDWLIADAEYLLSVANERLYLIGDVNTTRQALEAADQRLRESGDATAYKVRDQVIKDIAALADIKPVDVVGLYATIQTLEARINKLALLLPYAGKEPEKVDSQQVTSGEESGLLDSAKQKLKEIVTIKHSEHAVKEILTPEQAQFIRDQLRIKLEEVKVALVQQNEKLYQASLADSKQWVEQQFSSNGDSKAFIDELNRLNAVQLRSHFPDISLSLKMLRDMTKLRIDTDNALQPSEPNSSNDSNNASSVKPVDNSAAKPDEDAPLAPVTGNTQAMPVVPNATTSVEPEAKKLEEKSSEATSMTSTPAAAPEPIAPAPELSSQPPANIDAKPMATPAEQPVQQQPADSQPSGNTSSTEPASDASSSMDSQSTGNSDGSSDAAPVNKPSPVAKMIDKLKQYLPGKP